MPQVSDNPQLPKEIQERFARLDRRWKKEEWLDYTFLIAIFLLMIVGSIIILIS